MHELADRLNAPSRAGRIIARRFPEESIELCTAATILHAADHKPVGWSLRRLLQLRGNVVLSDKRAFIQSSLWSPMTLFWSGLLVWACYSWQTGAQAGMPILVLAAALLLQRRPYTRSLQYADLTFVRFGSVQGITARGDMLVLGTATGAIHLVTAQSVPPDFRRRIEVTAGSESVAGTST